MSFGYPECLYRLIATATSRADQEYWQLAFPAHSAPESPARRLFPPTPNLTEAICGIGPSRICGSRPGRISMAEMDGRSAGDDFMDIAAATAAMFRHRPIRQQLHHRYQRRLRAMRASSWRPCWPWPLTSPLGTSATARLRQIVELHLPGYGNQNKVRSRNLEGHQTRRTPQRRHCPCKAKCQQYSNQ